MSANAIPVIDLFAGPGGLGEGFSSKLSNERPFRIGVSIEMDTHAHRTLSLRAFFRYFKHEGRPIPQEYYQYLADQISRQDLEKAYPIEWKAAYAEALCAELGKDEPEHQQLIDKKIATALKGKKNWVLIGGPPCQAYSQIGRSCKVGILNSKHGKGNELAALKQFEEDPKHVLYQQYLRIIARHAPAVFVMENVRGILSSKLNGKNIFPQILEDLRDPHKAADQYKWDKAKKNRYRVVSFVTGEEPALGKEIDFLIKAKNYGVPQARERVILLGIREDLYKKIKGSIRPLKESPLTTLKEAIGELPRLRSGFSKHEDTPEIWKKHLKSLSKSTWLKTTELDVRKVLKESIKTISKETLDRRYTGTGNHATDILGGWYNDKNLISLSNHGTRTHQDSDLDRYLFISAYGQAKKSSPHLLHFPNALLPQHKNVDITNPKQKFKDRFTVHLWDEPSRTITCHISSDGHYYIHPDPTQCRALTVREAARLQTFPDNYFFEGGPRRSHKLTGDTPRYTQVGNAVPPYLAKQLAEVVFDIFKQAEI